MNIAIFDLDKTLISKDSGDIFSNYLCEKGLIVNLDEYKKQIKIFANKYLEGDLDFLGYYRFAISSLPKMKILDLNNLVLEFVKEKITPLVYHQSAHVLDQHRKNSDVLLLISATIDLLVLPIGDLLGFEKKNILAVQMENKDGYYTGHIQGNPSYGEGKVLRFNQWCEENDFNLDSCKTYFYSDSINDLPLLEKVDYPFVTNPDKKLLKIAISKQWPVIDMSQKTGKLHSVKTYQRDKIS